MSKGFGCGVPIWFGCGDLIEFVFEVSNSLG